MNKISAYLKKFWNFLWYDDSIWSWIVNIIVAFILIKFVVYPILSLLLGTGLPIVAVVSGSMEHKFAPICERYVSGGLCISYSDTRYEACGVSSQSKKTLTKSEYWQYCGSWYSSRNISNDTFQNYPFSSGFNTGDVMVVRAKSWNSLKVGDVIVWVATDKTPIIHRIVSIKTENGIRTVSTKGDHNADQITGGQRSEITITQAQYVGNAVIRIPYLGYVKLFAARIFGYLTA